MQDNIHFKGLGDNTFFSIYFFACFLEKNLF